MTSSIRPLHADDLPRLSELFDLYRQFYGQAPDPALAREFIAERFTRKESVVLVAETAAKELVGFCQLYPSFCSVEAAPIYTLYDLFVCPEARRLGAARQLLLAAETRATADGRVRMDLTTEKTNHQAQALYESLGWLRDEVFYAYTRRLVPGEPAS
ncbi:N-acetyltransferase [Hydrogenophaga sp. PAMC20947]|uniref:GNAT family N-acetyltransferase n=1 Tax=Hydrogenophaga sp. PAMC20947 TaxID=2565558 RepID=UPI00109DBD01|nr:N-acetyltransferase [Hydrogenophaga sp. PAMC20947]QCB45899.1 N-acetyltransferase [Hydrogenophaga sp. PAMC20947]